MQREVQTKEVKLQDVLLRMKWYNNHGYSCYIQGNGDGSVSVIAEDETFTI
jgi:hypothetical protein